jgi:hypothetical protein
MNDDYLWDRSGEPDPEIQELEQVLGTQRYQARPLEIPAQIQIERKRSLFPGLAIAAAIALMLLGVGLWLTLNRQQAGDSLATRVDSVVTNSTSNPSPVATSKPDPDKDTVISSAGDDEKIGDKKSKEQLDRRRTMQGMVARNNNRSRHLVAKTPPLTASERVEAEIAKEQLLLALRVASSKLSLAQKKAQSAYPANLIRNQHKVG